MISGSSILSTLHTLDAAETVIHMFDLFPPHERLQVRAAIAMLAGTLKAPSGSASYGPRTVRAGWRSARS